jgi:hypothetical protein
MLDGKRGGDLDPVTCDGHRPAHAAARLAPSGAWAFAIAKALEVVKEGNHGRHSTDGVQVLDGELSHGTRAPEAPV